MYYITRLELHNLLIDCNTKFKKNKELNLIKILAQRFNVSNSPIEIKNITKIVREQFFNRYFQKWNDSHRKNERFLSKCKIWLQHNITFDIKEISSTSSK